MVRFGVWPLDCGHAPSAKTAAPVVEKPTKMKQSWTFFKVKQVAQISLVLEKWMKLSTGPWHHEYVVATLFEPFLKILFRVTKATRYMELAPFYKVPCHSEVKSADMHVFVFKQLSAFRTRALIQTSTSFK